MKKIVSLALSSALLFTYSYGTTNQTNDDYTNPVTFTEKFNSGWEVKNIELKNADKEEDASGNKYDIDFKEKMSSINDPILSISFPYDNNMLKQTNELYQKFFLNNDGTKVDGTNTLNISADQELAKFYAHFDMVLNMQNGKQYTINDFRIIEYHLESDNSKHFALAAPKCKNLLSNALYCHAVNKNDSTDKMAVEFGSGPNISLYDTDFAIVTDQDWNWDDK